MSRSAIYTANTTPTSVSSGGLIPIGTTVRRFGCNVIQDGNAISIKERGYFKVAASFALAPAAAGIVTAALSKDGVPVIGGTASGSVSTAANPVDLSIVAIVRNDCGCDSSLLSFNLGGAASTLLNAAVTVEKL